MKALPLGSRRCLVFVPTAETELPFLAEWTRGSVRCQPGPESVEGLYRLPVVTCLRARESLLRPLEAPFPSRRKARKVLPTLLDVNIPFPLEECVSVFLDAPRIERGQPYRVFAVVARLSDLDRRLSALQKHGLDPWIVDYEGLALWTQSLLEVPNPRGTADSIRVVLHVDGDHSCLCVGKGTGLVGVHPLRGADPQDMARRLRMALDQARLELSSGSPITWVWAGPGAADEAVRVATERRLGADGIMARWIPVPDPALFLVRALATRALTQGPLRCNLRTGPREHPLRAVHRRRARTVAGGVLSVAGAMLMALSVRLQAHVRLAEAEAEREVAERVQRIVPYPVAARGADAVRVASAEATARLRRLRAFRSEGPSVTPLLAWVAEAAQRSGVRISRFAWEAGRGAEMTLLTSAGGAGMEAFLQDLRQAGYSVSPPRPLAGEGAFEVTVGFSP